MTTEDLFQTVVVEGKTRDIKELVPGGMDLFIPPEALEVFLENFEGPLDLLLFLIRRQKLDILNLPILLITEQYMEYIGLMEKMKFELAAEYLVMAATLAEIKSRLLLPKIGDDEAEEEDPRTLLIKQLQAYEVIKHAAEGIDEQPRIERDTWQAKAQRAVDLVPVVVPPEVNLDEMVHALRQVLQQAEFFEHHQVEREVLSTRERMSQILAMLTAEHFTPFQRLFTPEEGRAGVVVSFIAILELTKEALIELQQAEPGSQIHVRARA